MYPLDNVCSDDLHALLDYMLENMNQNGMIFLASIPEFTAYGGSPQRVGNYNSTVKKVAEDYEGSGKHVKFADIHGCLSTSDLSSDNLHPSGKGYEKMGKFWAETISDYLAGSSAVPTQPEEPKQSDPSDTAETPARTGSELLYSDFESGLSGWAARGSASVDVSKTEAASGKQSASVTDRSDAWNGISYDISSLCPEGTVIDVTARVKQSSGSAVKFKMTVQYGSGNGAEYDTFVEETVASGTWGTLAGEKYTVKSGSSPTLYIETDTDKCDFYVDDIIVKKSAVVGIVKDITAGLVQVNKNIQTVLFAPVYAVFDVLHTTFDKLAVFCLDDIIIYRHTHMIKSHIGYLCDIVFRNKRHIVLFVVIRSALGYPAAEVYSSVKSVKVSHKPS